MSLSVSGSLNGATFKKGCVTERLRLTHIQLKVGMIHHVMEHGPYRVYLNYIHQVQCAISVVPRTSRDMLCLSVEGRRTLVFGKTMPRRHLGGSDTEESLSVP